MPLNPFVEINYGIQSKRLTWDSIVTHLFDLTYAGRARNRFYTAPTGCWLLLLYYKFSGGYKGIILVESSNVNPFCKMQLNFMVTWLQLLGEDSLSIKI